MRQYRRVLDEAASELLARERESRRGHYQRERQWAEPGDDLKRHRRPGPHQLRILGVLVAYAEDQQMGLPTEAVRKIAAQGS